MQFLQQQFSNEEAYEKTKQDCYEYFGTDIEPLFWYALADTQWELGRLLPEVKSKALEWIEKKGGIEVWESAKSAKRWEATLEKLQKKLQSPMPPEKIMKRPVEFIRNPWNIGDVYAYQFHSKFSEESLIGKYIVFQKINDDLWYDDMVFSRIQVYDGVFDHVPELSEIEALRILPIDDPERFLEGEYDEAFPLTLNAVMDYYKKRDYVKKYFTYIGNQPDPFGYSQRPCNGCLYSWKNLEEEWLCFFYKKWRNYRYEWSHGKWTVLMD